MEVREKKSRRPLTIVREARKKRRNNICYMLKKKKQETIRDEEDGIQK